MVGDPDIVPAAIVPAPAIVPGRADQDGRAEDQRAGGGGREHVGGIIDRDIDALRLGRGDRDHARCARRCFLDGDDLLRRRLEIAELLRLRAQQLDDGGDVLGLAVEGEAERFGPVLVIDEHLDHVREAQQRHDRSVEAELLGLGEVARFGRLRIGVEPVLGLDQLVERRRARRQHQRQQRIGIERDRAEQVLEVGDGVEIRRVVGRGRRLGLRRSWHLVGQGGRRGWGFLGRSRC